MSAKHLESRELKVLLKCRLPSLNASLSIPELQADGSVSSHKFNVQRRRSCLKYKSKSTALPGPCLSGHKQNAEILQFLKFRSSSVLCTAASQSFPTDQSSRHSCFQAPTLPQLQALQMYPHHDDENSVLLTCAAPQLTPGTVCLTVHNPWARLPIITYPLQNTALSAELWE